MRIIDKQIVCLYVKLRSQIFWNMEWLVASDMPFYLRRARRQAGCSHSENVAEGTKTSDESLDNMYF